MAYTPELKNLMKAVEKTRPERVERKKKGDEFTAIPVDKRQEILRNYHPDFIEGTRKKLRVGPSKGYAISNEYADILEAKSRVDPDRIDLKKVTMETDILVIGGGGAGNSAALLAREHGAKVILATKLRNGDANTMMAEGGIQGASKTWKDSPYYHYLDVMGGGHFVNDPELVYTLVTEAPKVLAWLEKLGMIFSKYPDGKMKSMHGGGTSRKRMHYAGDITGAEIMRTIRDEVKNHTDDIEILEFCPAIELVLDDEGKCAGALMYNMETEEYFLIKSKAVIIATGGSGRLHIQQFMTTNHYGATGDGLIMGYRAGVPVCFLHTVQYHPTGAVFPEQAEGLLITEKVRGAGANLVNIHGEQFVFEREPRDVEAAAIIRECSKDKKNGVPTPTGKFGVWLDSPMIDDLHGVGTVRKEFPGKHILFRRYGINISKEPMLIYPTLHYQNGGLEANNNCETNVKGLYVAGETLGGIHGENRLMGNSLLDVTAFGRIAGKNAAEYCKGYSGNGKLSLDHVKKYNMEVEEAGIKDVVSPMLLPDYSNPKVRERQLTTDYLGTIR